MLPDAMPAGPSGPAQPGVITAVVAAITTTGTATSAAAVRDRAAARHRPVRQRRPPQQRSAADDQPELEDAAHHVQRADRFRAVQVRAERQADDARQRVHHDDDGVPRDAQRQPEPRRPPEQDRRPDQLRPGDHQEEDAVQGVFGEVLEHDREVDGRRADGERRQAAEQIRPGCGRPAADLLVRGDRSAHTTNARLPVAWPASATRPIRVAPGMYVLDASRGPH